ncbi:dienelactone hydrolase family protein [Leucobacter luti]|uniref:Dienelactone hydrolase n=1 Tax=Leucobacter luti TaxID=340320 RepID=A0A4Q7U0A6_9MICO|nr:dienelactone hydrolase family protein [Leucobacter luti]MBL3699307.1 hypothetical protein [Leucobacter luti]RZT66816.1 dienelactone hydrolase [Leucobacter luti]
MIDLETRDIAYRSGGTDMLGLLCAPAGSAAAPTVFLVHDAFGLGGETVEIAHRLASQGFAVFAADVWSGRRQPASPAEVGPLIGGMVGDRAEWHARLTAGLEAAIAQPEVDPRAVVGLGHCFGGSSVLELLRGGGALCGAIAIHPGLDLLAGEWRAPAVSTAAAPAGAAAAAPTPRAPRVLICAGADDPMATPDQRADLQAGLDRAGFEWELVLYSGTVHAFTSPHAAHSPEPHVFNYHPENAARAGRATLGYLRELFPARFPEPPGVH